MLRCAASASSPCQSPASRDHSMFVMSIPESMKTEIRLRGVRRFLFTAGVVRCTRIQRCALAGVQRYRRRLSCVRDAGVSGALSAAETPVTVRVLGLCILRGSAFLHQSTHANAQTWSGQHVSQNARPRLVQLVLGRAQTSVELLPPCRLKDVELQRAVDHACVRARTTVAAAAPPSPHSLAENAVEGPRQDTKHGSGYHTRHCAAYRCGSSRRRARAQEWERGGQSRACRSLGGQGITSDMKGDLKGKDGFFVIARGISHARKRSSEAAGRRWERR